jgi:hypothetical protein
MAFRIGQKVVCVDASPHPKTGKPTSAVVGAVYTVTGIYDDPVSRNGVGVTLAEILPLNARIGFLGHRFRQIVERKTDISIFKAMLNPQTTEKRIDAVLHDHGFDPPK